MNSFILKYLRNSLSSMLTIWGFFFLLQAIFILIKDPYGETFGWAGFFVILYVMSLQSIQLQLGKFIRLHSVSIVHFWANMIKIFVGLLVMDSCFFIFFKLIWRNQASAPANINTFSILWQFWILLTILILCFLSFCSLYDLKNQRRRMGSPLYRAVVFLAGCLWLALVGVLFCFSPLLGAVFVNASILIAFVQNSALIKSSFYPKIKYNIIKVGLAIIFLFAAGSIYIQIKWDLSPNIMFLSKKVSTSTINISEVDSVVSWAKWHEAVPRPIPIETVNQSLIKLEAICPVMITDAHLYITCCMKGQKEYKWSYLYGLKRSDKEIEILLDSPSIYSQFVGVVLARQLPRPLPLQLVNKIQQRAAESRRISGVASVTLSLKEPDKYDTYLEILQETDKRCQ